MVMLIEVTPPHPMPGWLDGWLDDTPPPQGGEDIIQPSINPPRWGGVGGCPYQPHSTQPHPPATPCLFLSREWMMMMGDDE